jgi:hypothetical protein
VFTPYQHTTNTDPLQSDSAPSPAIPITKVPINAVATDIINDVAPFGLRATWLLKEGEKDIFSGPLLDRSPLPCGQHGTLP